MEEINKSEISEIARKMGKFIIINFLVELIFTIFINDYLANLLHSYGPLSKSDPIEIDMLVRSSTHGLNSIIVGIFIFKPNIKDIFSNKNQIYKLSLKLKTKLTIFFISMALLSTIPSSFIMVTYTKLDIPMPETAVILSIFAIFTTPFIEEILNRGIILNQLKGIGYLFSIIISSVYFGSIHGIGFFHAFIIGLILGAACILTGNIRWPIIIHLIYNLTLPLIEEVFLRLFPNVSYRVGKLIIAIILLLIFLVISRRDKEIKKINIRINIKDIVSEFKKDKEKYLTFITEPIITVIIMSWIFIQLISVLVM
ncbi:type II CAAX endopeptidase family protein [Tissierella sp. MB52-C2]|uniref:CPBP family intramembrane glutamic endopeptidase n=1 Tax=Tissierella sp. MB52-C2 TaxID=3070999 RepID=UPI00280AFDC7|nr:type II CAAX endopeptidase family protein [Tissierella sp. MB52-C2]WMM25770.1 type II CAAX endopeptidase family protein [Tissierella sp. MB52-C2]